MAGRRYSINRSHTVFFIFFHQGDDKNNESRYHAFQTNDVVRIFFNPPRGLERYRCSYAVTGIP